MIYFDYRFSCFFVASVRAGLIIEEKMEAFLSHIVLILHHLSNVCGHVAGIAFRGPQSLTRYDIHRGSEFAQFCLP